MLNSCHRNFLVLPLMMALLPAAYAQNDPIAIVPDMPAQRWGGSTRDVAGTSPAAPSAVVAPAKAYEAGAIAPNSYRVIRRVEATNWLSAITVRTYGSEDAAKQALLATATHEGGDGVMHIQCLRSAGPGSGALLWGHYCYGNIIKLK